MYQSFGERVAQLQRELREKPPRKRHRKQAGGLRSAGHLCHGLAIVIRILEDERPKTSPELIGAMHELYERLTGKLLEPLK